MLSHILGHKHWKWPSTIKLKSTRLSGRCLRDIRCWHQLVRVPMDKFGNNNCTYYHSIFHPSSSYANDCPLANVKGIFTDRQVSALTDLLFHWSRNNQKTLTLSYTCNNQVVVYSRLYIPRFNGSYTIQLTRLTLWAIKTIGKKRIPMEIKKNYFNGKKFKFSAVNSSVVCCTGFISQFLLLSWGNCEIVLEGIQFTCISIIIIGGN